MWRPIQEVKAFKIHDPKRSIEGIKTKVRNTKTGNIQEGVILDHENSRREPVRGVITSVAFFVAHEYWADQ